MNNLYFKPKKAWAGDFIPFYENGLFHLFYLYDWRNTAKFGEGTAWYKVTTSDFISFEDYGEMIPRGGVESQDLYVFTGSVIKALGGYHIFYTGHNPHLRKAGKPEQAVMHATSRDLQNWIKVPEDTFFAPTDQYEPHDWRDPFVFLNPETEEYWMLLAARQTKGPSRRRGCTALCTSKDLHHWNFQDPFWAPGLYYTHECPDLFQMGDWWYLVFSEFSENVVTRYRMGRSINGPWIAPQNDTFDGRAFYAAKTASNGRQRFLFGWNPTREGEVDYSRWQWGGNLVVHEINQEPDGSLVVKAPDPVKESFKKKENVKIQSGIGKIIQTRKEIEIQASSSYACAALGELPTCCKIEADISFEPGTYSCGILLRGSEDHECGYYIRFEPIHNRLVFDSWPRPGDIPFMVELERPIFLDEHNPIQVTVIIDNSVCEVYAAQKIALSTRLYNLKSGNWGFFVQQGAARFSNISLSIIK